MVKHTYISIELSILKHPVVTVVNKIRKESNYGQELKFQSKRTMTIKTSRKCCQARWIEIKKSLHFKAHRSTPGYDQDI